MDVGPQHLPCMRKFVIVQAYACYQLHLALIFAVILQYNLFQQQLLCG
jgi:hypothetical protein